MGRSMKFRMAIGLLHGMLWFFSLTLSPSAVLAQSVNPASTASSNGMDLSALHQIAARVDSVSRSVERLNIQVGSELRASETRIEAIKEGTDRTFWIFVVLGATGSFIGGVFVLVAWARDRRQNRDYEQERRFYEDRALRYEQRQEAIHEQTITIAKKTEERNDSVHSEVLKLYQNQVTFGQGVEERARRYEQRQEDIHLQMLGIAKKTEERNETTHSEMLKLYQNQVTAGQQAIEQTGKLFNLVGNNLTKINEITSSVASGAKDSVGTLNAVLKAFKNIMEFKVVEAKDAAQLVDRMQKTLDELDASQKQQVDDLLQHAVRLIRKRFEYTNPDPDLKRQITEFCTIIDLMPQSILAKYTGIRSTEKRDWRYGEIFLRRGVIAYYENDPPKARDVLKIAEEFLPFSEPQLSSMSDDQKVATAFTQFYLALIEKNYGDIRRAQDHIEKSYIARGRDENNELLTPITRAEILSYAPGGIDKAREAIAEILQRVKNLRRGGQALAKHDAICAVRAHLLLGNTYYLDKIWDEALSHYRNALEEDHGQYYSYYAHHSIAQVLHKLGQVQEADEMREQAYQCLLDSGHLETKIALDSRILLNTLAYLCSRDKRPKEAARYQQSIHGHLLKIQKVDNLELRTFSLEQKRQISREELLAELFHE